jgi:outer membrane protein TolC
MVQGIIQAYWELVFAKTDLWAREQQVEQATFANERAQARLKVGDANAGEVAQTLVALENFRANLLASQANVLQRQAALLNILGLPPFEEGRTIPVTPMLDQRLKIDWQALNDFAQRHRPDIIELKLILEADQQRLLVSKNQALPQLDGVALYRWNGLEGEVPAGDFIRSGSGQFDDWALAVNFSVPVGLRGERAILRQQQLIIRRDQANLEQGLHQMQHLLALSVRNLDQYFAQYEKYQAVRRAAKTNLDQQLAQYNQGIVQFIVVLQAIVDWGNAVSNEAQALSLYNTEIATLAYHTGTILESLGRLAVDKNYPAAMRPTENNSVYRPGDRPSEESFELENPAQNRVRDSTTSQEPRDLNERIEFESNGNNPSPPLSDEEIDELLNGDRKKSNESQETPVPKSSWLTPKSLKRLFKR